MNNIQIAKGLQAISEGIALIAGAMIDDGAKQTAEQLPLVAQPQTEVKEEKPKRTRKPKEEPTAQAAATPAVETEADAFTETPAAPATVVEAAQSSAPATPQIDEATLRNKLVEYAQKHGKDKAYSILGKFDGAKKVNELKPEFMPKVYNELSAGL
jgi:hypothetical protein